MKDELGDITVKQIVSRRLRESGQTVEQVAAACGWDDPQQLRLILDGVIKLQVTKVTDLAEALKVDSGDLLQVVMQEYQPETWRVLLETFQGLSYSPAERMVIERVREFIDDHGGEADVVEAKGAVALVVIDP